MPMSMLALTTIGDMQLGRMWRHRIRGRAGADARAAST